MNPFDLSQPILYRAHPKEVDRLQEEIRLRMQYPFWNPGRRKDLSRQERRKRRTAGKNARRSRAKNR